MKNVFKNTRAENKPILGTLRAKLIHYTSQPFIAVYEPMVGQIWAVLGALLVCFGIGGCGTAKYAPLETNTETHYIDSVRWIVKDSLIIRTESVLKDYKGLLDTLHLENEVAEMKAFNDTTLGILSGELKTKPSKERSRIIYKDRVEYRDSLVYVDKPVPVEVPKPYVPSVFKVFFAIALCIVLVFVIGIILKFSR